MTVDALVDTGATYSVMPNSMLRRLRVEPFESAEFEVADGRILNLEIGRTWIQFENKSQFSMVIFGDDSAEPILGAVTLEEFRLAPDPVSKTLIPVRGMLK